MSAAVAAVIVLLVVAAPASAADAVTVSLRGLPSTTTPGLPATLQVTFSNTTNGAHAITSEITVQLDGMSAASVRVSRFGGGELTGQDAGSGTVSFTDPTTMTLQPRGKQQPNYFVTFATNAPSGDATITVAAFENGAEVGSSSTSTRIGAGGRATKTTPPNTNPGFQPTFAAGPTYSLAPLAVADQADPVRATVPKTLYVLGSMLVIMGVVTLFLIFRPSRGWRAAGARAAQVAQSWNPRGTRGEAPQQQWPVVGPQDPRRPYDPGNTGRGRAVRDPGPGENLPPWRRS
jgi:hypothetical protein